MIYKEETPQGVISINKAVVSQLIAESIRPYQGKIRLQGSRTAQLTPDGILIKLKFVFAIGESINDILFSLMAFLVDAFENLLEIKISDIVLSVDAVQTKKGNLSKRTISLSYSQYKEQTQTQQ